MDAEHFRGAVGGLSSMLLPANMITGHLGLLGIALQTTVVLVPTDKLQDATLMGMALERVGHMRYAILNGGWEQWAAEKRPMDVDSWSGRSNNFSAPIHAARFRRWLLRRPMPVRRSRPATR